MKHRFPELRRLDLSNQLNLLTTAMDDLIYFFYENGLYLLIGLAAIKVLLIFIYKGIDIAYLFENFLVIYSDHGIEPNLKRKRFRAIHNIVTVVFYIVLLLWTAVTGVVKFAK